MKTIREMEHNYTYVDSLPKVNLSGKFQFLKSAHETLVDDWLSFVNFYIKYDIPNLSTNKKNQQVNFKQKYTLDSNEFLGTASDKVLEVFGIKGTLNVIVQKNINGSYQYIAQTSYKELVDKLINYDDSKLGKLINTNTMIDRFFLYQYNNGKLLYPLSFDKQIISRNYEFKHYFGENEVLNIYTELLRKTHKNENSIGNYISTIIHLLTATQLNKLKNIRDDDLDQVESYIINHELDITTRGDTYLYQLNDIRRILVNSGRVDIAPPNNRQENSNIDKSNPTRFISNTIDAQRYPNLEEISKKSQEFMLYLKNDGLGSRTLKSVSYNIKLFLEYLIKYHSHARIDTKLIEYMFNPINEDSIIKYVKSRRSESSAGSVLGYIVRLLKYMELVTPYVLKHIPRIKKIKRLSSRKAMPKHMLQHLSDILTQRPPITQTIWDKAKADIDWWQHKDVYPVFPIMILIHLFIPLRGSQIRNLCREKSFELDEFGNVNTIIVNTDKNTGRAYLQEIPNVWEQLNFLSDFLKWHKVYFPHLPKIVYNDDENSRWDDITPLMITPKNYKPISQHTHMNYFKRVLMQYQIEINDKFAQEDCNKKVQILWAKDDKQLPKDIEELNSKPDNYFQSIASSYDIHSLRVTGATRYLEAGLGISLVMKLTGHTSPDMLLNVYNKLELEEKRDLLSTAVNKVFLTDGEDTPENIKNFLLDEIPNNYDTKNPYEMDKAFKDNNLFSLSRKSSSDSNNSTQVAKGTEVAISSHPSTWTPMIFGICPGIKCPDGRENRCSLCPYLITGRIFLDGVIHQANLKLINFYRLSKEIYEEQSAGYENNGKSEGIDLLFEEVMGWFEILTKIEKDIKNDKNLPIRKDTQSSDIIGNTLEAIELSYLKTNYNAMKMGVEKDHHGIAVLMIKAFHLINKDPNKELEIILEDETKMLDWLMSVYLGAKQNNMLNSFIKKLQ
ncbi:hypothetical protein [Sulfurimonas sp.]|uniref:hypothetical protein n=1 Tax=Sulfurimonas sp. TaxID=2022749 RepID=UPI0025F04D32|nr:hypothetical protein [Sulfurimonas sp.]